MSYRIDIYIGSDNGSKRVHRGYLDKVKKWANDNFPDGYTLLRGQGCYHGISEDSLVINVLSDQNFALRDRLEGLKQQLCQEAILIVRAQVDFEVV